MDDELPRRLVAQRRNHPAWLLLASRNAPLTLACLQSLVDSHPGGLAWDDAVEQLAGLFAAYVNDPDFDLAGDESHGTAARRELRQWLKRGLIVERDGQAIATDALQRSLSFLSSLEERAMTSTASRLATVQREIGELEARLNPSQSDRAQFLRERIGILEEELATVDRGEFEVLEGAPAVEGIREVYQLAVSLRADFRRVEDSYREADLALRQRIIGEEHHRGEIVDELLAANEALIRTPEGEVFEGFHRQLVQSAELERMKARLRSILDSEVARQALGRKQQRDLRQVVPHLVRESERVIQARARSERDVRGFLTSGLADEQLRVGAILHDVFRVALKLDWGSQKVRRTLGPFPPVAVTLGNIPLAERLLIKETDVEDGEELDFTGAEADPSQLDEEFWKAFRCLDRAALFDSTLAFLRDCGEELTLGALAEALPPTHNLETLTFWLAMARAAGIEIDDSEETIDLPDTDQGWTRFVAPHLQLTYGAVKGLDCEAIE
jgi:hypothetical protein